MGQHCDHRLVRKQSTKGASIETTLVLIYCRPKERAQPLFLAFLSFPMRFRYDSVCSVSLAQHPFASFWPGKSGQ